MTNTHRKALIGFGSNKSWLGVDSHELVIRAADALASIGTVTALSPLYRSPAWPDPAGPTYTNAVASLETSLSPEGVLAALQAIEAGFGRVRFDDPALRYAPRTLDLDLLAMESEVRSSADLTLPHPRMAERDFVLLPLRDVSPGWIHPVTGASVEEMISALPEVTAERL